MPELNTLSARNRPWVRRPLPASHHANLGKNARRYFELQTPGAADAPKVDFSR